MKINISEAIKAIDNKQSSYNEYMTDMVGDWLYNDRWEIEQDLGMTLEEYDFLTEFKQSLKSLKCAGYENWNHFSASESSALIKLGLNMS